MQLSEDLITLTMSKRNLSRKSAVQWLRRQTKTSMTATDALNALEASKPMSEQTPATAKLITDMVVALHNDNPTPEVIAAGLDLAEKIEVATTPALAVTPAPTGNDVTFDAAKCIEMFKANAKIVDIAVAMGYPRGSGQNRVSGVLVKAGLK